MTHTRPNLVYEEVGCSAVGLWCLEGLGVFLSFSCRGMIIECVFCGPQRTMRHVLCAACNWILDPGLAWRAVSADTKFPVSAGVALCCSSLLRFWLYLSQASVAFWLWHPHSLFWRILGVTLAQLQQGGLTTLLGPLQGKLLPIHAVSGSFVAAAAAGVFRSHVPCCSLAVSFAARVCVCLFCAVTAGVWWQKVCSCER
jgi:hypothetical protein